MGTWKEGQKGERISWEGREAGHEEVGVGEVGKGKRLKCIGERKESTIPPFNEVMKK